MENNRSSILEGLDAQQKAAVRQTEGPVLIVAGAGSGKTRVLTSRIAYILEGGCSPERILALTFTKKAATEMKERIAAMVGDRKARKLCMGTFHSVFIRFLREYADFLGYPQSFTIYDTSDSESLIGRCVKALELDDKVYKKRDVHSRISMAKNCLVTVSAYRQNQNAIINDTKAKKPRIVDIYAAYQEAMKQNGVMDFDDILLNMNILLRDNKEALASIASRFDYILVDEYQDTNSAQYLILKQLAAAHRNICVVGDDSQSIYAFRGARIENILNFKKDYPGCMTFRLEQNYRSTRNIVDAANSVIEKNDGRIPKQCYSLGEEGDRIRLVKAYTEKEEAIMIASEILSRMHSDHAEYRDFAILYRKNSQSRAIEEALRMRNLPYMVYSGKAFFDRAEVKDMMAYFKLVVNTDDDESFRRALGSHPCGIGATSLQNLAAAAAAAGCSLYKAIALEGLDRFGLKAAAVQKFAEFRNMIGRFSAKSATENADELANSLSLDCGLLRYYKEDNSVEAQSRAANIEELINSITAFIDTRNNAYAEDLMAGGEISDSSEITEYPVVTLGEYLEDTALLSAVDISDEDEEAANNKIALMTVHSAKGLEFPYVIVAGMEENMFPSGGMFASPSDIEEERRLFYVALTRAEKAAILTFAQSRMSNGSTQSNAPSRFIKEIDRRFVENPLDDGDFEPQGEPSFSGFGSRFGSRPGAGGSRYGGRGSYSRPSDGYSSEVKIIPGRRPAAAGTPKPSSPAVKAVPPVSKVSPMKRAGNDADFIPMSVLDMKEGQRIEHNRFGFGVIKKISGSPADLKAVIEFDDYGDKVIVLKYAKIRLAEN